METPKTFKELFANTGIEPTTDESGNTHYNFKATMKKETLEEAAKKYASKIWDFSNSNEKTLHTNCIKAFLKGAKWQQERSYSEEEVMDMFHNLSMHLPLHYEFLVKEQFKNK
jgi:hypothetical protein